MNFSSLVERIAGESAEIWDINSETRKRFETDEDVAMLSIGEKYNETTHASIQLGRHHYKQVVGENHLRKAIAKRHQKRTSQQISLENVCIFSGGPPEYFFSV